THGFRQGTRRKLRKATRSKFTVSTYLKDLKPADSVVITPYPASQKGMPYPKFSGLAGTIKAKRGRAYVVEFKAGNKTKTVIARPEHLKLVK
ncbi:MAG: 50S ribosomal protein L21e, partial [Candidatus Aenigmarchaeota archaeon]|nr:50S ribosomal protein L21e [Candidatus Aenigmarchaeota archaeon]